MFQKPVLTHYLQQLDTESIAKKFALFQKHFGNEQIQENYRTEKETSLQGEFLRALFGDVLGYTLSPNPNFNLRREQKNETNAKEADGAILVANTVRAVIELKDAKTPNLDKITDQAFGYHRNHSHCHYIITSNLQKLRFYIDKETSKIEFDLFNLSRTDFEVLYLCLSWNSIQSDLPQKILSESITQEKDITSRLYADYSIFKKFLFENLCQKNPQFDKLTLFKKTQKLLDRILFILFAEDRGLLRANEIERIVAEWKQLKQLRISQSLYERFKQYFGFLNTGDAELGIFPYNGGLFQIDGILDSIQIDDEILEKHVRKLAAYDFASEVDVNILGHIFEHSLTEIEAITAELSSAVQTLQKSKRKKDGIFYTPKYITCYIVEQTLGKLCEAKRVELGIDTIAEAIPPPPKKKSKNTPPEILAVKTELHARLGVYRDWLLSLKICDPSCGSGAFLNQTLEFLIQEHRDIDEIHSAIEYGTKDAGFTFPNVETAILENNLYGVDINDESVEIAKLSLWLRSAEKGRKLNDLSHRIKIGNSLIDDSSIAGDKAFDWRKEFPEVFSGNAVVSTAQAERCRQDARDPVGGFDVVIGNPPYFNIQTLGVASPQAQWIQKNYSEIWQDKSDILFYFIYKAMQISKGEIGLIVSNAFLFSDKAQKLRNAIIADGRLSKIVNFEKHQVFEDASITSGVLIFTKQPTDITAVVLKEKNYSERDIENILKDDSLAIKVELRKDSVFALVDQTITNLNKKIDGNHLILRDLFKIGKGMETAANDVFCFAKYPTQFPSQFVKKRMNGEAIRRYSIDDTVTDYLLYFEEVEEFSNLPAAIQAHLMANKETLQNRADKIRRSTAKWWNYTFPMHREFYHLNKIWCSYRSPNSAFVLDESSDYIGLTNTTVIFDTNPELKLKYLLTLLNSKLLEFRYKTIGKQTGNGLFEYFENGVGKLPIPQIPLSAQEPFINLAEKMMSSTAELQRCRELFLCRVSDNFPGVKISRVLEDFSNLPFGDFLKEMAKQKHPIPLKSQDEWSEYFSSAQLKCRQLQAELSATEKEIDRLVYALYGLTTAEIAVVEVENQSNVIQ